MTVNNEIYDVSYTGSGITGPFTVPFYFLEDDDLYVVKITIATGAEQVLALTTDYSVTGASNPAGGTLTLVSAISSSYKLHIIRKPDMLQSTSYPERDKFPSASHERVADKLTMLVQLINKTIVDKSIRASLGETPSPQFVLPPAVSRYNQLLGFDSNGDVFLYTLIDYGGTILGDLNIPPGHGINLGHATDTKIIRVSAGTISVNGVNILTAATGAALAGNASQVFSVGAGGSNAAAAIRQDEKSNKNWLINGGMVVQQRPAVSISSAYQYGSVDRWCAAGGGTPTAGSITAASGMAPESIATLCVFGYSSSGASTYPTVQQRIEKKNCYPLRSKTVTISAWVYHNTGTTRTYTFSFTKFGSLDVYAGATTLGNCNMSVSSVPTGTWTKIVGTFLFGASDCDNGIALNIDISGSDTIVTKDFYYTNIKLEEGSVATPFVQPSYGDELALCQRYYERVGALANIVALSGYCSAASQSYEATLYYSAKRIAPTCTKYGTWSASNCGQPGIDVTGGYTCVRWYTGASIGAGQIVNRTVDATTYMEINSEL